MAAKKYIQGACEVCEKQANITKSNGKFVCSTCEHIVRAVRNKPDVVRRLMRETYGDDTGDVAEIKAANTAMASTLDSIKAGMGIPDHIHHGDLPLMVKDLMREVGLYAAEINSALMVLEYDPGDSLADVAERRMAALRELDESYAEAYERAECLEREADSLRAQLQQLKQLKQLKHFEEANTCLLGIKNAPADHIPITKLLSDKNLLAAINTLADALEEV